METTHKLHEFRAGATRIIRRALLVTALLAVMALSCGFSDVPSGAWYEKQVNTLSQFGVINGYSDGTFRPGDTIKRSEFIKMLSIVGELYPATNPKGQHWADAYWMQLFESDIIMMDILRSGKVVREPLFVDTSAELEKNITRQEMAVLVSGVTAKAYMEPRLKINSPESAIRDYAQISDTYKDAVEQAYGKGIITGFTDTSFRGEETLTRAQAAVAVYRLLFGLDRVKAPFAEEVAQVPVTPVGESFAIRYRNMSEAERRTALFGSASKTYFYSATDAAPYIVNIEIRRWKVNSSGQKESTTATLQVHRLVADEIKAVFDEVYNDPERFPIQEIGGARFTDSLRHSWGCAIDINPTQNFYCRRVGGYTTAIVGTHWSPGTDQYSMAQNGSVVRAFAKYGWGWGGQGWSGGYYDYMHFSLLSSGG